MFKEGTLRLPGAWQSAGLLVSLPVRTEGFEEHYVGELKECDVVLVKPGEITRAYITNVANTRTFQLKFKGAITKLVGGDIGRIEKEKIIDSQIMGTAERYVVELYYDKAGTYAIEHRGKKMGIVTVVVSDANRKADFNKLRQNTADYTSIRSSIGALLAQEPDKNLRLDIDMKGAMGDMMNGAGGSTGSGMMMGGGDHQTMNDHDGDEGIEWEDDMAMMNQMSTDKNIEWVIEDQDTGKKNHDINWSFKTGDLVKVRVYNDEKGVHPMQHPLHFHGQRFVVLAKDGKPSANLQWKDTVLIPKGQTVDLLVDMSNAGKWMAHCHIAEHLHAGMMFQFEVK